MTKRNAKYDNFFEMSENEIRDCIDLGILQKPGLPRDGWMPQSTSDGKWCNYYYFSGYPLIFTFKNDFFIHQKNGKLSSKKILEEKNHFENFDDAYDRFRTLMDHVHAVDSGEISTEEQPLPVGLSRYVNAESTKKIDGGSARLTRFIVSVVLAIPLILIAAWVEQYQGLFMDIVYWFFSVWTIFTLVGGTTALLFGYQLGQTKQFWIAFFLNIPIQFFILNI